MSIFSTTESRLRALVTSRLSRDFHCGAILKRCSIDSGGAFQGSHRWDQMRCPHVQQLHGEPW